MSRYAGFTKQDIINKLDIISKNNKEQAQILREFINDSSDQYISASKNICFRTWGPINYYYMLINQLNLKIKWNEAGLSATAKTKLFSIDWVEHDIILALH